LISDRIVYLESEVANLNSLLIEDDISRKFIYGDEIKDTSDKFTLSTSSVSIFPTIPSSISHNNVFKSILVPFSRYGPYNPFNPSQQVGSLPSGDYNTKRHIQFDLDPVIFECSNTVVASSDKAITPKVTLLAPQDTILDLPKRRSQRIQEIKEKQDELLGLVKEIDYRTERHRSLQIDLPNRAVRSNFTKNKANRRQATCEKSLRIGEELLVESFIQADALVGQFYLHPETKGLYEIVGTRKDRRGKIDTVAQERNDADICLIVSEDSLHRLPLEQARLIVVINL
jgi:hypothetical protein